MKVTLTIEGQIVPGEKIAGEIIVPDAWAASNPSFAELVKAVGTARILANQLAKTFSQEPSRQ